MLIVSYVSGCINEDLLWLKVSYADEIFLPKEDVGHDEMDEHEREIEEFKRFCLHSQPKQQREKLQVNVNLKDIFSKKKSGLGIA